MLYFIAGVLSPQPEAVSEVVMMPACFLFFKHGFFWGGGRRYNLFSFREADSRTVRSDSIFFFSGVLGNGITIYVR